MRGSSSPDLPPLPTWQRIHFLLASEDPEADLIWLRKRGQCDVSYILGGERERISVIQDLPKGPELNNGRITAWIELCLAQMLVFFPFYSTLGGTVALNTEWKGKQQFVHSSRLLDMLSFTTIFFFVSLDWFYLAYSIYMPSFQSKFLSLTFKTAGFSSNLPFREYSPWCLPCTPCFSQAGLSMLSHLYVSFAVPTPWNALFSNLPYQDPAMLQIPMKTSLILPFWYPDLNMPCIDFVP